VNETIVVVEAPGRAGTWACRSLRRAGFRIVGTAGSARSAKAALPECDVVKVVPSPQDDGPGFLDRLAEAVEEEGASAVMQTDNEGATELLTRFFGRTRAAVVGPDAQQFSELCDKAILPDTLRAAGLDTPGTVVVGRDGAADLPPVPCIVKPASAGTGSGDRHVHHIAAVAHDVGERDELVRELVEVTGSAVVQERVVGTPWRIHFVASRTAFVSLPVQTRLSHPREAGMSTVQYVPDEAPEAIFANAERLIRHAGYVGPGSVQFLERDGTFYIHDVNLRLPASVAVSIKAGLDLPALAVECALGREDALARVRLTRGVTYVWLAGEMSALLSGVRRPRQAVPALVEFTSVVGRAAVSSSQLVDRPPLRAVVSGLYSRTLGRGA
jgi:carbamoyl-phosphate synthase large subunit